MEQTADSLLDAIRAWCLEEGVAATSGTGDEDLILTPPAPPRHAITARVTATPAPRLELSQAFDLAVPSAAAGDDVARTQLQLRADYIAAGRASLTVCTVAWPPGGAPRIGVTTTVHGPAVDKQAFLVALAEVGKVRKLLEMDMEAAAAAERLLGDLSRSAAGPAAEPEPAGVFCTACGHHARAGEKFCAACGHSLEV